MSEEVRIGRKYSLVIPKRIRKQMSLREGQRALIHVEDERIVIDPLPADADAVLNEVLGDFSYEEKKYEKRAEELLKRLAGARH